jgi:transcriptional regulator with XRE-family HTH domain
MSLKAPPPHVPYSLEFGSYLKEKRLAKGLSQADLSEALGYETAQVVSNWERGIQSPPFEKLVEMCKLLSISRKDILQKLLEEQARVYENSMKRLWSGVNRSKRSS